MIPSNECEIELYLSCKLCLEEIPRNKSPAEYGKLNIGWTKAGLQVWCIRHEVNILHVDFEGQTHPANTSRKVKK